jgi:hypothetical protein
METCAPRSLVVFYRHNFTSTHTHGQRIASSQDPAKQRCGNAGERPTKGYPDAQLPRVDSPGRLASQFRPAHASPEISSGPRAHALENSGGLGAEPPEGPAKSSRPPVEGGGLFLLVKTG